MKFLLIAINAKYIHSNPAIYSLRAYAGEELQQHIELAEYTINQQLSEILADIYDRQPEAIGISCYIWNMRLVRELLLELPKLLPQTDIWLGGPEVSYDAEELLQQYKGLTGIFLGEGEGTFRELLQGYLRKQTEWSEIAGLCLATGATASRKPLDISEIPFLYHNLELFTNKIIYYESSRGCPYRCSYCLSSLDRQVRLRNIETVKRELQFFLDNRVKQVKFVDRTFNCNHEHAMAIWQYLYEHDNGITNFHFEIAADILSGEELALLRRLRPGLAQLEIGVQSVHPKTLQAISRRMDIDKLEQIVEALRQGNNIHLHLDLIAGLPYEDYESFEKSFDRVYQIRPEQLQLGFLKVLKGSAMHEKAEEYGLYYLSQPPYEVLATSWLSYREIGRLKRIEEMVEQYYNSNQFTRTLPFLEQAFASPFAMYEKMADFYVQKGYVTNSPARAYRYQILLEFAQSYDAGNEAIYRELLTYDMYLREKLKSRPEFAQDITEPDLKEVIREFYLQEEKKRTYLPGYAQYNWKQLSKMTHLEPFWYPVWEEASVLRKAQRAGKPAAYLLFDYQSRNLLTQEAATTVVLL